MSAQKRLTRADEMVALEHAEPLWLADFGLYVIERNSFVRNGSCATMEGKGHASYR